MDEAFERPEFSTGIYLEIVGPRREKKLWRVPVNVKSLSAGGVVLRADEASGKFDVMNLDGLEAVIHLPDPVDEDLREVRGKVLWSRSGKEGSREYLLGLELADPDLRVRKVLEDHLRVFPRDIKDLWDQWDLLHGRRPLSHADQAVYLAGMGALVGGTALYFVGPESFKLFGSILAIYGCLMMAAKSLWSMWQGRVLSRD